MDESRTTICKLPDELIVDILTFLPVKSLLRFKCVCKSWYSLISSAEFVKLHLGRAEQEESINRCSRVLFPSLPAARSIDFEAAAAACMGNHQAITTLTYPDAILLPNQSYVKILGSCNGLVCLSNLRNDVVLWNPSTRVSKILPKHSIPRMDHLPRRFCPRLDVMFSGLGYDKSTDDYKLIVGQNHAGADHPVAHSIEALTLKSSCWRKIENQGALTIVNTGTTGIYFDQFIHWIGWRRFDTKVSYEIVSFEVSSERFKDTVPFPEEVDRVIRIPCLGLSRNRLCLFCECSDNCFEVWIVEGLGNIATWTKLFIVDAFAFAKPLCLTNNGKIVLHCSSSVSLFDALKVLSRVVYDPGFASDSSVYLETLVSPNY